MDSHRSLPSLLAGIVFSAALPCSALAQETHSFEARIDGIEHSACEDGQAGCLRYDLQSEDVEARETRFSMSEHPSEQFDGRPPLRVGDRVIVESLMLESGQRQYAIVDVVRRPALTLLFAVFLLAVAILGGIAALRSFSGMIFTFALLFFAMIPAMLRGMSPLTVSITGSVVIVAVTFTLSHGRESKTLAAAVGTILSLFLTGGLALLFSALARLTGLADEETVFLLSEYASLDPRGILLAGIIIGSLGVLDDVTIAQASAVMELRLANPLLGIRELYVRALRIGRDHIAAAVNTLILAYAGSSLPLLLLLTGGSAREPWSLLISREAIATEIVRTLVGSMGLLAAVPLTTILAAVLTARHAAGSADHSRHAHRH